MSLITSPRQGNTEANFVRKVPECMKCIVCHNILNKAIQSMKCGHRYCTACYQRCRSYAQHLNIQLTCPIDQEVIDSKVFDDTAMDREIRKLQVMCGHYDAGCTWIGSLVDLPIHEGACWNKQFTEGKDDLGKVSSVRNDDSKRIASVREDAECRLGGLPSSAFTNSTSLHGSESHSSSTASGGRRYVGADVEVNVSVSCLDDLARKLCLCEDTIDKMNSEMAKVKTEVKQLQENVAKKDEELVQLKKVNSDMQEEIDMLKKDSEETKQSSHDRYESLKYQNILLENRVELLGKHLEESDASLLKKDGEIADVKAEVERLQSIIMDSLEDRRKLESMIAESSLSVALIQDELRQVQNNNTDREQRIVQIKDDLQAQHKEFELAHTKETVELKQELNNVVANLTNMQSIQFCESLFNKNIQLKWTIHNFNKCREAHPQIVSPLFYVPVSDYRIQIVATFTGSEKQHFGLFLNLHRGANHGGGRIGELDHGGRQIGELEGELELFDGQYTFEVRDREGNRCYDTVTRDEIAAHRDECFAVHPGERCVRKGYGGRFLSSPRLEEFIVNDVLTVNCLFELNSTP